MTMDCITVTAENLESVKDEMSCVDQSTELAIGCLTWGIYYAGQNRGQMTVWPDGRGAVEFGGPSLWGDWDSKTETLTTDDGEVYDSGGSLVIDEE